MRQSPRNPAAPVRRNSTSDPGFTLIELLTVIAIIAILAALLFPLAGTVREQARASDCMSKLHQLWVSANVYRQDEGAFPPALYGYVEQADANGNSLGVPLYDPASQAHVNVDRIIYGFLYNEQIKDSRIVKCPDNYPINKGAITVAYYPNVQSANPSAPHYWPPQYRWIGDVLWDNGNGCPKDPTYGVIDCWYRPEVDNTSPLWRHPKYFYTWDSYDAGPMIDANGQVVRNPPVTGPMVFERHYSRDWTGVTGAADYPAQLKYENPPSDKTMLAYCTWHYAIAGSATFPAISMAGTAKKIDYRKILSQGPGYYFNAP